MTPGNLTDGEKRVFDLVARRFISVFWPECTFSTTTVLGKAASVEFKVSGKEILKPGWRVLYANDKPEKDSRESDDEKTLPSFTVGENGPHTPELAEKWTQALERRLSDAEFRGKSQASGIV